MATAAIPYRFRTCESTGLRVHVDAEALLKVNAVLAVVFLAMAGTAALLVLLTRWPALHLLDPVWFYRLLTFHGANALLFWMIFFEMAILYFAGPIVLNSRLPAPSLGWLAAVLMLGGAVLADVMILTGQADVLFTAYAPLRAHPLFYLGYILFAVGALIVVGLFFASLVVARAEGTYQGSVPLVTFGGLTAAIIALVTIFGGVITFVPAFFWSLGVLPNLDPAVYRLNFWLIGHPSQQINVSAMVAVWYLLASLTVGATAVSEKVSRIAFTLYILFINIASAHHLLVDPGLSPAWKIWNTSYAMHLAVLASMIHGLSVPAAIEVALRRRGFNRGLFEWLWRAPWGNPAFAALVLSVIIFGVIGGISGVVFGTEQISIISHNTYRIVGHFHGTVVGGTTLAFMGLTYYVIPLIFRRQVVWSTLARIQPYLFGIGIVIMTISMVMAGTYGVPRRHWDIDLSLAPAGLKFAFDAPAYLFLTLTTLGGILAVLGGALYVLITVVSVFAGPVVERIPIPSLGPIPAVAGGQDVPEAQGASQARVAHADIRGTLTLNFLFLGIFVVYYLLNWKWLADVWPVR